MGAGACVIGHFSGVPSQAEELKAPVIIASGLCLCHAVQVSVTSRIAVLESESICGGDEDEDKKDVSDLVHLKLHFNAGFRFAVLELGTTEIGIHPLLPGHPH